MLVQATMRLKVPASDQLIETMREFSRVAQFAYDYARANKIKSWKTLHQKLYRELRSRFKLTSQLTCKAIKSALETKKGCKNRKVDFSRELAIQYDQRSYSFDFSGKCSLSTLNGRYKCKLFIPEYYMEAYRDWEIRSATLSKSGKELFLNVVVTKEVEPGKGSLGSKVVGIDVGINNLATTSEGQFFRGVKHHIARIQRLRSALQSKGTKSARKHLGKLKGRQARFMRSINHLVSKKIVSGLGAGDIIVMENLRGIRAKRRGRELNKLLSTWAFGQLKSFMEYKAVGKGIVFVTVPPAYSSQACSRCHELLSIRPRNAGFFKCLNCGYSCNADLNASFNLREQANALRNVLGPSVNRPIVGTISTVPASPRL
ncbi:MAG: transposase [Candidatus Micrarchaeota archaeon]